MRMCKRIIPFLVLCVLLSGCQEAANLFEPQESEEYSSPIFSRETMGEELGTGYVIALDQSNSMKNVVPERNSAAEALINSLPGNSQAAVLFFDTECEEPDDEKPPKDMLPMADAGKRKILTDQVKAHDKATTGGTDLGEMMEGVLKLINEQDENLFKRFKVFVVTDGWSDGRSSTARDKRFFELCQNSRDKVDTYVVYINTNQKMDALETLCGGLVTEPVVLESTETGPVNECRNQLTTWQEDETGKVLTIYNINHLEMALLNLLYSDADAIFTRSIMQNTTISFPIYPLCARELTIALTNGTPVEGTLSGLKLNGGGADLLKDVTISANPSVVTLFSEEGLEEGTYTLDIAADQPVTLVISCKYGYQVQYCFEGVDTPSEPPPDIPLTFHMRLLKPDGSVIKSPRSVTLSARIHKDGELREIQNDEVIQLTQQDTKEKLELFPVVSYGGVTEELSESWQLTPTDTPPVLTQKIFRFWNSLPNPKRTWLCSVQDVAEDQETPAENLVFSLQSGSGEVEVSEDGSIYFTPLEKLDLMHWHNTQTLKVSVEDAAGQQSTAQWEITMIWVVPIIFMVIAAGILVVVFIVLSSKIRQKQREQQVRDREERLAARQRRKTYAEEVDLDTGPVRAGLRWKIEANGETYIGGLGLYDAKGQLRKKGCDLKAVQAYVLTGEELKSCPNPLPFGLWKYSKTRNQMELMLEKTPDAVISCSDDEPADTIESEEEGGNMLWSYGVDRELPFREVVLELPGMRAVFQLEYYADQTPFYN